MKLLSFAVNEKPHVGAKLSGGVFDLSAAGYLRDFSETIRDFRDAEKEIRALCDRNPLPLLDEKSLSYLPPASAAAKILCVGLNYKLHVDEAHKGAGEPEYPKDPILFSKFNNALNAHNGPVSLSSNARQYDYEAELVVVIGKSCRDVAKENAADYIFGYTCGNDLSARDAQRLTSQWLIGKSFPGFAPAGPWIVTADEIDPFNLAISCRRGDRVVQNGNTSQMIFDVYTIVSFASRYIQLEPGDLIFTGTPNGVILGGEGDQQKWLEAGEEVTVTIEQIGDLRTVFV
ncbi:MAG: fumarylacetoacetate hydrolase family protein [Clostridiales bacterium]|nr:fumarylacetoacetate hydrolase family protein [Clostridiales bacterium]